MMFAPIQSLMEHISRLTEFGIVFNSKTVLAGGAIRRALCDHDILAGDFDIYYLDYENNKSFVDDKVSSLNINSSLYDLTSKYNRSSDIHTVEFSIWRDKSYEKISPNIGSMTGYDYKKEYRLSIQLHKTKSKTIDELFYTFDYTCCQFAFDGSMIYCTEMAYEDIQTGTLRYTGAKNNVKAALFRGYKFMRFGFTPTPDTLDAYNKILIQICNESKDANFKS